MTQKDTEIPHHTLASKITPLHLALLVSVFIIAACGLIYELAAGAVASYLLGDSILQFSTIIGCYLFAMGVGSFLTRYFDRHLSAYFLRIELLVALVGGFLPSVIFLSNAYLPSATHFLIYFMVFVVGVLVGLEIPLVMRLLKKNVALKDLVSEVLTYDYLGALAVSLAFPLFLVPQLGLIRTGLIFGLMNAAVAFWALYLFRFELKSIKLHLLACVLTFLVLLAGLFFAKHITSLSEDKFYQDKIVLAQSTPYQRIVLTQQAGEGKTGFRLFLNGNLQFAQRDEYRYHEALVHPIMAAHGAPKKIAVLGGGDGMAVREILRYPSVESITLVELDPNMTQLFKSHPDLIQLNGHSLLSNKLKIINTDAFKWLEESAEFFDVIVVDFPDPTNFNVGKLYTNSFYSLLEKRLNAGAYAVIQTTSPLIARQTFWTVAHTIESVGLQATPYHAHVPSFGEWGFIIASHRPYRLPTQLPEKLQFLTAQSLPQLFIFPPDMARVPSDINRLSNQILVNTYEQEWGKIVH